MRLLVVKLSSIGDVVHTLPAVAAVRRSRPDIRISWAVDSRASAILHGSPVIDDLVEIDSANANGPLKRIASFRHAMRRNGDEPPDVAIDFQGLIKSGLVAYSSQARRRVGFESADLREPASRFFLNDQVKTSHIDHVIEKNIELVRASLGISIEPGRYEFPVHIPSDDEAYIDNQLAGEENFAILNPGGGWPTKMWAAHRFGMLADWLLDEFGMNSIITFGPTEEHLAAAVAEASRSRAARALPATLKQFTALSRRARLFIGGDTGPLHLAAASGTPIVGLYGPTSPARNGPFDHRDVVIGRDLWCRAECHRRSCWHWNCLDIEMTDVQSAVRRRLEA